MADIVVLGAGGWGIALALNACRSGHTVTLWSPFEEEIAEIHRYGEHRRLLPGVPVPPSLPLTADLSCVTGAQLVIVAVPSFAVGETAARLRPYLSSETVVTCAAKGLEKHTHRRLSQVIAAALPQNPVTVLSGPSHAEEVARGIPTSLVSAGDHPAIDAVQEWLMNDTFRVYLNEDIVGVELGGALKNAIALAAGICDGMNLGDNTKAALMTRGLAEIARLGVAMGARADTFAGLSGMGDLIVTCGSLHSRNHRAGMLIGQGMTPEAAVQTVGTVEGYYVASTARELAQEYGIEMPILEQCCRICSGETDPARALAVLMGRPGRHEHDRAWM